MGAAGPTMNVRLPRSSVRLSSFSPAGTAKDRPKGAPGRRHPRPHIPVTYTSRGWLSVGAAPNLERSPTGPTA
jgi:hypothetical protein